MLNLASKENLSLRLSGSQVTVSFVSNQIYKALQQYAEKKGYSSSMLGYKSNKPESVMQVYVSLSNPESHREPRGRTTHRIVLNPEAILKLASKFVRLDRKNNEKIEVRVQAKSSLCIAMREEMSHILRNFLQNNDAQLEIKNFRNYKDQRFETMDILIFCCAKTDSLKPSLLEQVKNTIKLIFTK
jgi:hypothetical protein